MAPKLALRGSKRAASSDSDNSDSDSSDSDRSDSDSSDSDSSSGASENESGQVQKRPSKRTKSDYFKHVMVLVGPRETPYLVPKTIICDESRFFKAACQGKWKEASEALVRLPEVDPYTFGVYVGWLHTGELDFSKNENDEAFLKYSKSMPEVEYDAALLRTIEAYILGHILQDRKFCNTAVNETIHFFTLADEPPRATLMATLWTKVPPGSPMAKLLVDYITFDSSKETFAEEAGQYPVDFMIEVAKAGVRDRDWDSYYRTPRNRGKCFYHEHENRSEACG